MEYLPKVLIHIICNYLKKTDIDNMYILSKKIHEHILKYKLEHFYFCGSADMFYKYNKMLKLVIHSEHTINHIIEYNCCPNLTNLTFGYNFNQNINALQNSFPNLTSLTFGYSFDQCIDELKNSFPNLISLTFGSCFNQNIDALQNSFPNLTSLTFGFYFNQNIDALKNSFPNLTSLTFSPDFNQNIDALQNSFPNLTSLTFGYYFNQNDTSQNSFPNLNKFHIKNKKYNNIMKYLNRLY